MSNLRYFSVLNNKTGKIKVQLADSKFSAIAKVVEKENYEYKNSDYQAKSCKSLSKKMNYK